MEPLFAAAQAAVREEIAAEDQQNACERSAAEMSQSRALRNAHAPTNFVAGETRFASMQAILADICGDGEQFVDLGCGKGEVVAAAMLLNAQLGRRALRGVLGLDLMHFQLDECRRLVRHLEASALARGEEHLLPVVVLREDDFTRSDWAAADVVYACATVFSDALMQALRALFLRLQPGARVVLLDRELDGPWALRLERQIDSSWGCGHCRVYERVSDCT